MLCVCVFEKERRPKVKGKTEKGSIIVLVKDETKNNDNSNRAFHSISRHATTFREERSIYQANNYCVTYIVPQRNNPTIKKQQSVPLLISLSLY
mmetsp:Transcript_58782/g.66574  ORF Transcript_58782/g.66574 Transcript_58782/m.66574 type:complete len:94 (-) Transcript_58782:286-567(-)